MDQDTTWYGGRLRPRPQLPPYQVHLDPSSRLAGCCAPPPLGESCELDIVIVTLITRFDGRRCIDDIGASA